MTHRLVWLLITLLTFGWVGCSFQKDKKQAPYELPHYHFTAGKNWTGEPVGAVWDQGVYHLFYQYNPEASVFGPVVWYHATSRNLINWEQQGPAVFQGKVYPTSYGCVFVDPGNKSGLGSAGHYPFLSCFAYREREQQEDMLYWGYSLDKGVTWTCGGKLDLYVPEGESVSHPRVTWSPVHQKWILTLSMGSSVCFYSSHDGIHWQYNSVCHELLEEGLVCRGVDCLPIKTEGSDECSWTLVVNMDNHTQSNIPLTRYFFGSYQEGQFILSQNKPLWVDYGMDNTAGVLFQTDDDMPIHIGWMNSWNYANLIPSDQWRGSMTLPMKLSVIREGNHQILLSEWPDTFLQNVSDSVTIAPKEIKGSSGGTLKRGNASFIIQLEFDNRNDLAIWRSSNYGIRLMTESGKVMTIGYQNELSYFYIDRTGFMPDIEDPTAVMGANYRSDKAVLDWHIFFDQNSVQLVAVDGRIVLTSLCYPDDAFVSYELFSENNPITLEKGKIEYLK